jgi:ABC-type xylose transport system substrate-binding protein
MDHVGGADGNVPKVKTQVHTCMSRKLDVWLILTSKGRSYSPNAVQQAQSASSTTSESDVVPTHT